MTFPWQLLPFLKIIFPAEYVQYTGYSDIQVVVDISVSLLPLAYGLSDIGIGRWRLHGMEKTRCVRSPVGRHI